MMNFLYSDFITRLNNAKKQHFKFIKVNNTSKILATLQIFYNLGLIKNFCLIDHNTIMVYLKYHKKRCVFKKLKVISLPSKRIYLDLIKLAKLKDKSNCSFYIISTSKGLKTDFECDLYKLCGEILLKVEL